MVRFETSHGAFTVELYAEDAPQTVENFLRYVDEGFFEELGGLRFPDPQARLVAGLHESLDVGF